MPGPGSERTPVIVEPFRLDAIDFRFGKLSLTAIPTPAVSPPPLGDEHRSTSAPAAFA